jgi:hypothetical protein
MAEHDKTTAPATSSPRSAPGTDPTNPYRRESVGEFVPAERINESRMDEPGLTDADREARAPCTTLPEGQ